MGLFKGQGPSEDLIKKVDALDKAVRDIRLDWDEMYEKFARLNQRLAKRMRDYDKQLEKEADTNGHRPDHVTRNPLAERLLQRGRTGP